MPAFAIVGGFVSMGLATGTAACIVGGLVIGAVVGGVVAAVTGGNILEGVLVGAAIGGLSGGMYGMGLTAGAGTGTSTAEGALVDAAGNPLMSVDAASTTMTSEATKGLSAATQSLTAATPSVAPTAAAGMTEGEGLMWAAGITTGGQALSGLGQGMAQEEAAEEARKAEEEARQASLLTTSGLNESMVAPMSVRLADPSGLLNPVGAAASQQMPGQAPNVMVGNPKPQVAAPATPNPVGTQVVQKPQPQQGLLA